ncbi:MAG: TIGR00341 family protein [Planctomycetota bacterium]|jgi:uncharacterized hydrophobic protein (TIGR00341 family)
MSLRLIELTLADSVADRLSDALVGVDVLEQWREPTLESRVLVRILVRTEKSESVLDALERQFTGTEGFRVILLPVEATIPRPPEPEPEPEPPARGRVGREELLDDLASGTRITTVYLAMVVLSTIVAAVGLIRNNVAVVIGAMVIAPLLTPNVALALGTTLGDFELMRKALRTNLVGLATALVLAVVVGAVVPPAESAEIMSRTETGFADIVLALAAGAAGALAFTTGVPATLVGVMVAVALLPPLVTAGLRLAAGDMAGAGGAFLLLMTNVICVNLAAVVTFLLRGVGPRTWWEADKAKRATRKAVLLWGALLLVLALIVWWTR